MQSIGQNVRSLDPPLFSPLLLLLSLPARRRR